MLAAATTPAPGWTLEGPASWQHLYRMDPVGPFTASFKALLQSTEWFAYVHDLTSLKLTQGCVGERWFPRGRGGALTPS